MKYILTCLLSVCVLNVPAWAQHTVKKKKPPLPSYYKDDCTFYRLFDSGEHSLIFPFDRAASVIIAATITGDDVPDTMRYEDFFSLPAVIRTDTLGCGPVKQVIVLDEKMRDRLFNLMFHYFPADYGKPKGFKTVEAGSACFDPEFVIIFFDTAGKTLAKTEICTRWEEFRLSPETLSVGAGCNGLYHKYRAFLESCGIKLPRSETQKKPLLLPQ